MNQYFWHFWMLSTERGGHFIGKWRLIIRVSVKCCFSNCFTRRTKWEWAPSCIKGCLKGIHTVEVEVLQNPSAHRHIIVRVSWYGTGLDYLLNKQSRKYGAKIKVIVNAYLAVIVIFLGKCLQKSRERTLLFPNWKPSSENVVKAFNMKRLIEKDLFFSNTSTLHTYFKKKQWSAML